MSLHPELKLLACVSCLCSSDVGGPGAGRRERNRAPSRRDERSTEAKPCDEDDAPIDIGCMNAVGGTFCMPCMQLLIIKAACIMVIIMFC